MDDALLDLQPPRHAQERRRLDDRRELGEHLRPDDQVHEPGLVLERHAHPAARRARLLPADHDADVLRALAIATAVQRARIRPALRALLAAQRLQWMAAGRVIARRVIPE